VAKLFGPFIGNHLVCGLEASDKEPMITASERALVEAMAELLEETELYFVIQGATTQRNL
jgi:hypothetical protein